MVFTCLFSNILLFGVMCLFVTSKSVYKRSLFICMFVICGYLSNKVCFLQRKSLVYSSQLTTKKLFLCFHNKEKNSIQTSNQLLNHTLQCKILLHFFFLNPMTLRVFNFWLIKASLFSNKV